MIWSDPPLEDCTGAVQQFFTATLRSRREARQERHCDRRVSALTTTSTHFFNKIETPKAYHNSTCPQRSRLRGGRVFYVRCSFFKHKILCVFAT